MTNKRVFFSLLLFSILALSLFSHFVIAQSPSSPGTGDSAPTASGAGEGDLPVENILEGTSFFSKLGLEEKWNLWLKGGDLGALGNTVKILFLLIVILLIYSSLSYAKFPESSVGQVLLAIIVGIMATFLITTNELITIMQSYKALGITLSVFLPIMILAFFTMVVSSRANPIGIFIQKIVWVIFSVYLFLKTAAIAYLMSVATISGGKLLINGAVISADNKLPAIISILLSKKESILVDIMTKNDTLVTLVLLITSIAVFIIMVLSNKVVIAWLAKERINAEVETQRQMIERSHSYDKSRAEAMQKGQ